MFLDYPVLDNCNIFMYLCCCFGVMNYISAFAAAAEIMRNCYYSN